MKNLILKTFIVLLGVFGFNNLLKADECKITLTVCEDAQEFNKWNDNNNECEENYEHTKKYTVSERESCENITHMDLSYQNLTKIPEALKNFTSLTELFLYNNNISEIKNLPPSLTYLELKENQITKIEANAFPASIDYVSIGSISYPLNITVPTEEDKTNYEKIFADNKCEYYKITLTVK